MRSSKKSVSKPVIDANLKLHQAGNFEVGRFIIESTTLFASFKVPCPYFSLL